MAKRVTASRHPQPATGRGGPTSATVRCAVIDELRLPLFVKPANMGSSIGITKAKVLRRARAGHRPGPQLTGGS